MEIPAKSEKVANPALLAFVANPEIIEKVEIPEKSEKVVNPALLAFVANPDTTEKREVDIVPVVNPETINPASTNTADSNSTGFLKYASAPTSNPYAGLTTLIPTLTVV